MHNRPKSASSPRRYGALCAGACRPVALWRWLGAFAIVWGALLGGGAGEAARAQDASAPVATAGSPTDASPGGALPFTHFHTIGTRDGLSHPAVFGIGQDRFGFLWLGTVANLDRFDGYTLRTFSPADAAVSASCSGPRLSVFVDRADRVWSGTLAHGACMYDTRTGAWRTYLVDDGADPALGAVSVRDFLQDAAGGLWMATSAGLAFLEAGGDAPRLFRHASDPADGAALDDVMGLAQDAAGTLWLATRGGVVTFDPAAGRFAASYRHDPAEPESLSSDRVFDVMVDRAGLVWIATWGGGLNRLDPQTGALRTFRHDARETGSLSSDQVMKVLEDHAGRVWIGTYGGGLNLFDATHERFIHFRAEPGNPWNLSHDHIVALFEDRIGSLWIGTEGGGVSVLDLDPLPFTFYRRGAAQANTLAPGLVTAIAEGPDGTLWIGTNAGGLNRLVRTSEQYTTFSAAPEEPTRLASNVVSALAFDAAGVLWVGTAQGLHRFDAARQHFVRYQHDPADPTSLTDNTIYAITPAADGTLWIGGYRGLNHFDPTTGKTTRYTHAPHDPNSLSAESVRVLMLGDGDALWIGTQRGGLNRLARTTGQITRYTSVAAETSTLSGNNVTALARDGAGMIWVGTEGAGLNRLDPQTGVVTRFGAREGLPDMRVLALAYVADSTGAGPGALWMSTGAGLARYDLASDSFASYGASDGLPDTGFVTYASYQSQRGELFFGGVASVVAFDPAAISATAPAPAAELTELFIESQPAPVAADSFLPTALFATDAITLPADVQTFTLAFAAPGYWETPYLRFRYRLQGYDPTWIEAHTTQRAATYTNLRPGEYRFAIQAAGRDGLWETTGRTLQLTLTPAWWEEWWVLPTAAVTCGSAAIALLASGFQAHLRRSRRRNQALGQEVAERTAELSALLAISQSITSARDLEPLLVQILGDIRSTIPHAGTLVILHTPDDVTVQVYRLLEGEAALTEARLPATVLPPLLAAVETGASFQLRGADADLQQAMAPLLPPQIHDAVWQGAMLTVRAKVIGLLLLFDNYPSQFEVTGPLSLERFANQVAIALENSRLYTQSQQLAVVVERNRLSRELHDTVTQYLHTIGLHTDAAERALALGKPETTTANLQEAQYLVREALAELRAVIVDLRLTTLQETGLAVALQAYLDTFRPRNGLAMELQASYSVRLPVDVEFELYRIAQEALANVVKHARATHVQVILCTEQRAEGHPPTVLKIVDDGIGFDVLAARQRGTFGLHSITERAQKIGADLTLTSEIGRGSIVKVEISA